MTSTQSLFIGIPAYGGIDGLAFRSHLALSLLLQERKIPHTFHVADNLGDIVRIRNGILAAFMRSGLTHLLMADADVAFPPAAVVSMLGSGHAVVGAAVPMRRLNFEGLRGSLAGVTSPPPAERLRARTVQFNVEPKTSTARGDFLPVKALGTALMMVDRSAIEKMAKAYPELEHVDSDGQVQIGLFNHLIDRETRRLYGEDVSFCRRHTSLGGDIYCLTNCPVTHTGPIALSGNLLDVERNILPFVQRPAEVV